MKMKKLLAVFLAAVTCVMCMSFGAFAADNKGVTLNKSSITAAIGKTYTLKPTVTGYSKYTLQWSSSDKSVATVKKGGVVTAKGIGTATVTVKVKGTSYKAQCTVKVVRGGKISDSLTGAELVSKIKVGTNLGNTLDAWNNGGSGVSNEVDFETYWGNPRTTEAMILKIKAAGFNAIRIPVSWGDHIDQNGNISKAWLDRVQEVVDYAYDNGMYVILNTHHEDSWLGSMTKYDSSTAKKFSNIWKQIATRFKNYDERLIFEGLNEPRTIGSDKEWEGGTAAERKVVNKFNQLFVDTVRAAGGNNENRCLIITTYGGNTDSAVLKDLEIPDDDKIIVSVHAYMPWTIAWANTTDFTNDDKRMIDDLMNTLNENLIKKGVPVVIDEFDSMNNNNESERAKCAEYFVGAAKKYGIACFWWDNGTNCAKDEGEGFGLLNRNTLEWYYPEIVKAMADAAK